MTLAATTGIAARFEGLWHIHRDIYDLDSNWAGRFRGQGVFSRSDDGLAYREEGLLKFGGLTDVRATRSYIYRFPAPDRVEVYFDDGRFFHAFDPTETTPEAEHLCAADLYEVRYIFESPNRWRAEWRVEGPRKDYRMVTVYDRAPIAESRA